MRRTWCGLAQRGGPTRHRRLDFGVEEVSNGLSVCVCLFASLVFFFLASFACWREGGRGEETRLEDGRGEDDLELVAGQTWMTESVHREGRPSIDREGGGKERKEKHAPHCLGDLQNVLLVARGQDD